MLKYAYFLIDLAVTSVMIIQGDGDSHSQSSISGQQQYLKGKNSKNANVVSDRSNRYVTTIVWLASAFWKLINYCSSLKFSHWHAISFFCWVYLIWKKILSRILNKPMWSFFMRPPDKKPGPESIMDGSVSSASNMNIKFYVAMSYSQMRLLYFRILVYVSLPCWSFKLKFALFCRKLVPLYVKTALLRLWFKNF